MILHDDGHEKKTKLAMKSHLSYDKLLSYLEWLETMDMVEKDVDSDGFQLIALTEKGMKFCDMN